MDRATRVGRLLALRFVGHVKMILLDNLAVQLVKMVILVARVLSRCCLWLLVDSASAKTVAIVLGGGGSQ